MLPNMTLREKLVDIDRLEHEHAFSGIRFTVKEPREKNCEDPETPLRTEEVVDFVRDCLYEMLELSSRMESAPFAEPDPPV